MKSRVIICVIACLGALAIVGCGGDDEPASDTTDTTEETSGVSGASGVSGDTSPTDDEELSDEDIPETLAAALDEATSSSSLSAEDEECFRSYVTDRITEDEYQGFRDEALETGERPQELVDVISAAQDSCGIVDSGA